MILPGQALPCDFAVRAEAEQPPCLFPAVMNSSLSRCCAAEQRASFVPGPSQTGRPVDDVLGCIRDCGCLVPDSLQISHWNMSQELGGYFFFNPQWETSVSKKLSEEGGKRLANASSCCLGPRLSCGRGSGVGLTLLSAVFLLLISCVIWCCDDYRAGPGSHAHSFAVYLQTKGHW